jgi:hypothetical protein
LTQEHDGVLQCNNNGNYSEWTKFFSTPIWPRAHITSNSCWYSSTKHRTQERHERKYSYMPALSTVHTQVSLFTTRRLRHPWRSRNAGKSGSDCACHRVLNEDPCRMWIYAVSVSLKHLNRLTDPTIPQLTFGNSMASVWCFSRSHSVNSTAFNWIKITGQIE